MTASSTRPQLVSDANSTSYENLVASPALPAGLDGGNTRTKTMTDAAASGIEAGPNAAPSKKTCEPPKRPSGTCSGELAKNNANSAGTSVSVVDSNNNASKSCSAKPKPKPRRKQPALAKYPSSSGWRIWTWRRRRSTRVSRRFGRPRRFRRRRGRFLVLRLVILVRLVRRVLRLCMRGISSSNSNSIHRGRRRPMPGDQIVLLVSKQRIARGLGGNLRNGRSRNGRNKAW